jgi:hypothetical protein
VVLLGCGMRSSVAMGIGACEMKSDDAVMQCGSRSRNKGITKVGVPDRPRSRVYMLIPTVS